MGETQEGAQSPEAVELMEMLEALRNIDNELSEIPMEEFVKKYLKLKKKVKKLKQENKKLREGKGELSIDLRRMSDVEIIE